MTAAVHMCLEMTSQYITFVSHSPLSTSGPALTVENILTAVQGVPWTTLGRRIIPSDTYHEIKQQCLSNDSSLRSVIEHYLQGESVDKEPSWRRIILALDREDETRATAAADTIRHFAEPLPGKSCDSITFLYIV